jgi:hypothetical protein
VGATALPEQVSVAMSEIAENMQEGLLALAVGAGLQVMAALMEADVTELAGPKGRHDEARTAVRHGRERGSVTLGGRRVAVARPRVRVRRRLSGSCRLRRTSCSPPRRSWARWRWRRCSPGCPPAATRSASNRSDSRSLKHRLPQASRSVSRRFVAMTETALAELLSQDLSGLDLVALMIDGVHFAQSCCVVALGIDIEGNKHPLALVEGSTENATLVTDLLVGLRARGLDVTRSAGGETVMFAGLTGHRSSSTSSTSIGSYSALTRQPLLRALQPSTSRWR